MVVNLYNGVVKFVLQFSTSDLYYLLDEIAILYLLLKKQHFLILLFTRAS